MKPSFFVFERRAYIATQAALVCIAVLFHFLPSDWFGQARAKECIIVILKRWPKMRSDAANIAIANPILSEKYVLASAAAVCVSAVATTIAIARMLFLGPSGDPPYYVNHRNLVLFARVMALVVYAFYFDEVMAGMVSDGSRRAQFVFGTPFCLGFSACGIGLVGTGLVRGVALYWRWLSGQSLYERPPTP